MATLANYLTSILAKETNAQLQAADDFILFIGYPTCSYCHCFGPELTQVAKDNQLTVHFLNDGDQDPSTQELRIAYGVPTVPGLLVIRSGHAEAVHNSSLSEEVILDSITH